MPERISEKVAASVENAIRAMDLLVTERDAIGYEVAPVLVPVSRTEFTMAFMVAVCVPVPGSLGEHVLVSSQLDDPYASQDQVTALVGDLYRECAAQADQIRQESMGLASGHVANPGRLIIP